MSYVKPRKRTLLAVTGSVLLLLAGPSQATELAKLEQCLEQANGNAHETSQCYWRHFQRQASFAR